MPKTVLVFEDSPPSFALIKQGLIDSTFNDELRIVHFQHRLTVPDRAIYPISVEKDYEPSVTDIINGCVKKEYKGKPEWWQCDFDAAVLDNLLVDDPVGVKYLEWLDHADFSGPVVMATKAKQLPGVPQGYNRTVIHKEGAEQPNASWVPRAIKLLQSGVTLAEPWERANYRGREPSTYLRSFYSEGHSGNVHKPSAWKCAYFGPSQQRSQQLSSFFCLNSCDNSSTFAIECFQSVIRKYRPHVAWIDLGNGTVDDELATQVLTSRQKALQSGKYPIVFLITESVIIQSNSLRDELGRFNIVTTGDTLADDPARAEWAGQSILALAKAWRDAKRPKYTDKAILPVIQKLATPIMMARTVHRIVGQRYYPSLASWTSRQAHDLLNTSFYEPVRRAADSLYKDGLISKQQHALV